MKRSKAEHRALWMANFETALRMECLHRGVEFPAGRIDWNAPTHHYLAGEGFAVAARRYVEVYITGD